MRVLFSQPLCFKDLDNVSILNNYAADIFAYPQMAIAYCKNRTSNGEWCKSEQEIKDFLRFRNMYLLIQENLV